MKLRHANKNHVADTNSNSTVQTHSVHHCSHCCYTKRPKGFPAAIIKWPPFFWHELLGARQRDVLIRWRPAPAAQGPKKNNNEVASRSPCTTLLCCCRRYTTQMNRTVDSDKKDWKLLKETKQRLATSESKKKKVTLSLIDINTMIKVSEVKEPAHNSTWTAPHKHAHAVSQREHGRHRSIEKSS